MKKLSNRGFLVGGNTQVAVLAHNDAQTAHGFGVYTVAELNAFTSAKRPTGCVYCSDCLTPEGVGSPVVWNGTKWVTTCSGIPATTDALTFFRGVRAAGRDVFSNKLSFFRIGGIPYGVGGAASGTGASRGSLYDGETIQYYTGSTYTPTGWSVNSGAYSHSLGFPSSVGTHRVPTAIYTAADVNLGGESVAGDSYVARLLSLQLYSDGGNVYSTKEIGFYYDAQNNFCGAGASPNIRFISRNASVQSVTDTLTTPDFVNYVTFELLYTPTQIRAFINGVELVVPQMNIPIGLMRQTVGVLKYTGTTMVVFYCRRPVVGSLFA